jgi:hypothetical protein
VQYVFLSAFGEFAPVSEDDVELGPGDVRGLPSGSEDEDA